MDANVSTMTMLKTMPVQNLCRYISFKAGRKCATRWAELAAGNSKSHRENSISFIFLESPHRVDMKTVVKSSKHFFLVFQYSRNSPWIWRKITVHSFIRDLRVLVSSSTPPISTSHKCISLDTARLLQGNNIHISKTVAYILELSLKVTTSK